MNNPIEIKRISKPNPLDKGPKALTVSQMARLKKTIEKTRKRAKPQGREDFMEYVD